MCESRSSVQGNKGLSFLLLLLFLFLLLLLLLLSVAHPVSGQEGQRSPGYDLEGRKKYEKHYSNLSE